MGDTHHTWNVSLWKGGEHSRSILRYSKKSTDRMSAIEAAEVGCLQGRDEPVKQQSHTSKSVADER